MKKILNSKKVFLMLMGVLFSCSQTQNTKLDESNTQKSLKNIQSSLSQVLLVNGQENLPHQPHAEKLLAGLKGYIEALIPAVEGNKPALGAQDCPNCSAKQTWEKAVIQLQQSLDKLVEGIQSCQKTNETNIQISQCLISPIQTFSQVILELTEKLKKANENQSQDTSSPGDLSLTELRVLTEKMTIKVKDDVGLIGSGFFLSKKGNTYFVGSNDHVATYPHQSKCFLETFDGENHECKVILLKKDLKGYDLAVIQFESTKSYEIPKFNNSTEVNQSLLAVGFPVGQWVGDDADINAKGFAFLQGKVSKLPERSWGSETAGGGFRIGSSHGVRKGMSGGPLFNHKGEIVGINGLIENVINAFVVTEYQEMFLYDNDRSQLSAEELSKLYENAPSWGIPVQILLDLLKEKLPQ
jgi:S1-C subfamily serine protease